MRRQVEERGEKGEGGDAKRGKRLHKEYILVSKVPCSYITFKGTESASISIHGHCRSKGRREEGGGKRGEKGGGRREEGGGRRGENYPHTRGLDTPCCFVVCIDFML